MRLGIVTTWFERGAAYVSWLYRSVVQQSGHDVRIYARGGEYYAQKDLKWNTPDVWWGKKVVQPWGSTYIDKYDFINWIKQENISILLFNEQHIWEPVLWAKKIGIPCISYIDYYTEETIPFFDIYDAVICNTERHKSVFSWHKNCKFIPWGTDINLFSPSNIKNTYNSITFFHSCGMSPYRKGTDIAIKSFYKTTGNAHLYIHSQCDILNIFPNIKHIINQLLHKKRLTIYEGNISAPGLYHNGDVYIYPSRLDGIGLSQIEALSCGLPIIVPDYPPMNEFISEDSGISVSVDRLWSRSDGYYWPQCSTNIDNLTSAMQYYIDNIDTLNEKKLSARNYAINNLDWFKNAKDICIWMSNIKSYPYNLSLEKLIYKYQFKKYNFKQQIASYSLLLYNTLRLISKLKQTS